MNLKEQYRAAINKKRYELNRYMIADNLVKRKKLNRKDIAHIINSYDEARDNLEKLRRKMLSSGILTY